MLKRVSIQNFKSLKDVTLDLQKVNLLIGPNNSGKTNFLKALEFFSENIYKSIDNQNSLFPKNISFDKSHLYKKDFDNKMYMHFIFNNEITSQQRQVSLFEQHVKYQHFRLRSEKENYYYEHWYSGDTNINSESFYGREYSVTKIYLNLFFQQMKAFSVNPYLIAKPCPLYPNSEKISYDTSNTVAFLDTIRDYYPNNFKEIQQSVNLLQKDFSLIRFETVVPDKDLRKVHGDKTYKRIGLYNELQEITYWADELSEGVLYFLALLCIINQPNPPKLLLLEEPEKGIHPRRIREVMDFIFRLAQEKDIQIILTSHNEHVLDDFATRPESVFVFDKDEEGATYVRNLQKDIIGPTNQRNRELGLDEIDFTSDLSENWIYGLLGGGSGDSMSRTLRYTLVGEGFAEYQFIPAYIEWAAKQIGDLKAVRTNIQIAITKNPSVSKVLQEVGSLCARSFADERNSCDLFIAGIDLDEPDFTDDLEIHGKRVQEMKERMGKVYKQYEDKTILYIPIQAIDCWVCYVQYNATVHSLESINKDETKKKVYGERTPDRQRIEKVVREAALKADFAKLAKQSRSFAHFHNQVTEFLEKYA